MITIGCVTSWVIINRKRTSFKDFSYEQLLSYLSEKSNNNEMLLVLDGADIAGLVCFHPKAHKELFIDDILTTRKGTVKKMLETCKVMFPGYHITGIHRTGRNRNFKDQDKLARRL